MIFTYRAGQLLDLTRQTLRQRPLLDPDAQPSTASTRLSESARRRRSASRAERLRALIARNRAKPPRTRRTLNELE
jgi:hypothetical protein